MRGIVGIELTESAARAVLVRAWGARPARSVEVAWNPNDPAEAVNKLRQELGAVSAICLSVGVSYLHMKQASLPPALLPERKRILAMEPDRFFAIQDEQVVVALADDHNFAFAASAERIEGWIVAFEEWAPVECVEAAPVSFARALSAARATGQFGIAAGVDEAGLVELSQGTLQSARRIPAITGEAADLTPLPEQQVAVEFLCALGAAQGAASALEIMLLPELRASRIRRRRLERLVTAATFALAALAVALWSVDRSRERLLERVRVEVGAVQERAQPALQLRDQLATLELEARASGSLARARTNPLEVLAVLSKRLPAGVTVLNLRASADQWQIDGSARDAAEIVPLLDQEERFEGVRFLSASTRYREEGRNFETFSIAFRVREND